MGKLILVTGGARSGKSGFAEKLAKNTGEKILYIATSIPFDDEMKDRVKKHRESRPNYWSTYEGYKNLGEFIKNKGNLYQGILLDCITIMISNLLFDFTKCEIENLNQEEINRVENCIFREIKLLIDGIKEVVPTVILVTNEIGFGIVPENKLARVFRDIVGRINQYIATCANEVFLVVSSIPLKIK